MSQATFDYTIDGNDTIVSISDNWHAFAEDNAWDGPVRPRDVVGHSLWRFIQGPEVQRLYQAIFSRVRNGHPCRALPFRCDSPVERRYLELNVEARPAGHLHLRSTIVLTERRHPVKVLESRISRSSLLLKLCSVCKKMRVSPEHWAEIDQGMVYLRIFEANRMPQLSHDLCNPCLGEMMGSAGL